MRRLVAISLFVSLLCVTSAVLAAGAGVAPKLVYSTYAGEAERIAVGRDGAVYFVGDHGTCGYRTPDAFDTCPWHGANDPLRDEGAVGKLDPSGSTLGWLASFGGPSDDDANAVAVDAAGDTWVAGFTRSTRFPTTPDALRRSKRGLSDAYLLELDPSGTQLRYSTLLGGSGDDDIYALQLDARGNIIVGGLTASPDFPTTTGAFQRHRGDRHYQDAFVMKLDPSTHRVLYSTLLGGAGPDDVTALAVDRTGNAYVTGETESKNFPTTRNAAQHVCGACAPQRPGYAPSSFVAKLDPTGRHLRYGTFLGGRFVEHPTGIAVDRLGNAYVAGQTASTDFPTTAGALSRRFAPTVSGLEGTLAKLNATGTRFTYATFVPGGVTWSVAVDGAGTAWLAGWGDASFPTTPGSLRRHPFKNAVTGSVGAGYLARVDRTGARLEYATFLGPDPAETVVLGHDGSVYAGGEASCGSGTALPTTASAWHRTFQCGSGASELTPGIKMDAAGYVVKLRP